MKKIILLLTILLFVSCSKGNPYKIQWEVEVVYTDSSSEVLMIESPIVRYKDLYYEPRIFLNSYLTSPCLKMAVFNKTRKSIACEVRKFKILKREKIFIK